MPEELSEAEIQTQILIAIGGRPDIRLWRNNVGAARRANGRTVRFGLKGSSDLMGVLLIPELDVGVLLCIEVKSKVGRLRPAQNVFRDVMTRFRACHIVARSVEDAIRGIESFKAEKLRRSRS